MVKPHWRETTIFWRPGNLNFARRKPSTALVACTSLVRMESMIWPMAMRAAVPCTLPNAPRMPVCRRSAPAQESILLMRRQWKGCMRTRRWN